MPFEEKLRRTSAWAGLSAGALGVLALSSRPWVELDQSLVALGLVPAGAALWFESHGHAEVARRICAALAFSCAALRRSSAWTRAQTRTFLGNEARTTLTAVPNV